MNESCTVLVEYSRKPRRVILVRMCEYDVVDVARVVVVLADVIDEFLSVVIEQPDVWKFGTPLISHPLLSK